MTAHHCPAFPCPICYPNLQRPPHYPPDYPHYGYGTPAPRGCVCPVGAEKTCQGPLCPRKPTIAGGAFGPVTAQGIETEKPPRREADSARKGESPVVADDAPKGAA